MLSEDTSDVEVLREAVPPEDTSGSVPPAEEPILRVARVGEFDAARASELASPYRMTISKPQGASSGLSLLLRRKTARWP